MNRRNRRAAPELPVNSLYTRTPPESEWVGREVVTLVTVTTPKGGIPPGQTFTIRRRHGPPNNRAYRLEADDGTAITAYASTLRRPSAVGFLHKRENSNEAE